MLPPDGLQVGSDDGKVDVFQILNRLEFHDNGIFHEEIEAMATDFLVIIAYNDFELVLDRSSAFSQSMIRAFS